MNKLIKAVAAAGATFSLGALLVGLIFLSVLLVQQFTDDKFWGVTISTGIVLSILVFVGTLVAGEDED